MSTPRPLTERLKTLGISPKAVAAFLWPFVAALGAALVSWIVSGEFNENEVRTAVGGAVAGAISAAGAFVARPGQVVPDVPGREDVKAAAGTTYDRQSR